MDSGPDNDAWKKANGLWLNLPQSSAESSAGSTWDCTNYPSPNTKNSFHFAMFGVCFSVMYRERRSVWEVFLHHPLAMKRVFGPFASKSQAFAQCDALLDGGPDDPRYLGSFPVEALRTAYPNGVIEAGERERYMAMAVQKLKKLGAFVGVFLTKNIQGKPVVCGDVSCNGDKQLLELLDAINNAWSRDEQLFGPPPSLANRDWRLPASPTGLNIWAFQEYQGAYLTWQ